MFLAYASLGASCCRLSCRFKDFQGTVAMFYQKSTPSLWRFVEDAHYLMATNGRQSYKCMRTPANYFSKANLSDFIEIRLFISCAMLQIGSNLSSFWAPLSFALSDPKSVSFGTGNRLPFLWRKTTYERFGRSGSCEQTHWCCWWPFNLTLEKLDVPSSNKHLTAKDGHISLRSTNK